MHGNILELNLLSLDKEYKINLQQVKTQLFRIFPKTLLTIVVCHNNFTECRPRQRRLFVEYYGRNFHLARFSSCFIHAVTPRKRISLRTPLPQSLYRRANALSRDNQFLLGLPLNISYPWCSAGAFRVLELRNKCLIKKRSTSHYSVSLTVDQRSGA